MDKQHEKHIVDLIEGLKKINYIKPNELPNIDLYMDQVTTFMDKHLESSKRYSEDKLLTKTMINNYTKNNLLPSPEKKKYTKDHMYLLIFIYYMKNILSINDIQSILGPMTEMFFQNKDTVGLEEIYEEIFRLGKEQTVSITKDVLRKQKEAAESFPQVEEGRETLQLFSLISMLCLDVYMKKQMIEKLVDENIQGIVKEKEKQSKQEKKTEKKGKE